MVLGIVGGIAVALQSSNEPNFFNSIITGDEY